MRIISCLGQSVQGPTGDLTVLVKYGVVDRPLFRLARTLEGARRCMHTDSEKNVLSFTKAPSAVRAARLAIEEIDRLAKNWKKNLARIRGEIHDALDALEKVEINVYSAAMLEDEIHILTLAHLLRRKFEFCLRGSNHHGAFAERKMLYRQQARLFWMVGCRENASSHSRYEALEQLAEQWIRYFLAGKSNGSAFNPTEEGITLEALFDALDRVPRRQLTCEYLKRRVLKAQEGHPSAPRKQAEQPTSRRIDIIRSPGSNVVEVQFGPRTTQDS